MQRYLEKGGLWLVDGINKVIWVLRLNSIRSY
jgi:hypothetical protein